MNDLGFEVKSTRESQVLLLFKLGVVTHMGASIIHHISTTIGT